MRGGYNRRPECYAKGMRVTIAEPIRSVYVHVPFCHSVCGYCDFYKQRLDPASVAPLVEAIQTEARRAADRYPLAVETLFVGGGTPTSLPARDLDRLLQTLRALPRGPGPLEFTVEANPNTITDETAELLCGAEVNRVSIGAQSFDPAELHALDRRHRPEQVRQSVETLRNAGFRRLNLDLIFAVPGQTLESWTRSLDAAIGIGPEHLSCYGLTYERGTALETRLRRGEVQRAAADVEADMYEATIDRLAAAGLEQYEISNFARPGEACRHNLAYWHNLPCLGFGPSAAGFDGELRYKNVPDTAAYVQAVAEHRSPWVEQERLAPERRARETVMLELRLNQGIDRAGFAARFGQDPAAWFAEAVERHVAIGTLTVTSARIALTRRGLLVADSVTADFLG